MIIIPRENADNIGMNQKLATLSKEDMGEVFERQIPRLKPEYSNEINTDSLGEN